MPSPFEELYNQQQGNTGTAVPSTQLQGAPNPPSTPTVSPFAEMYQKQNPGAIPQDNPNGSLLQAAGKGALGSVPKANQPNWYDPPWVSPTSDNSSPASEEELHALFPNASTSALGKTVEHGAAGATSGAMFGPTGALTGAISGSVTGATGSPILGLLTGIGTGVVGNKIQEVANISKSPFNQANARLGLEGASAAEAQPDKSLLRRGYDWLMGSPGGTAPTNRATTARNTSAENAIDDLASGTGTSKSVTGGDIQTSAVQRINNISAEHQNIITDLETRRATDRLDPRPYIDSLSKTFGGGTAPGEQAVVEPLQSKLIQNLWSGLETTLQQSQDGKLGYDTAKTARTLVGYQLDSALAEGNGTSVGQLKTLYRGLSETMRSAYTGMERVAFDKANLDMMKNFQDKEQILNKIVKEGVTPERIFNWVGNEAKQGATKLIQVRNQVDPDTWQTFAGTTLQLMGRNREGVFDLATYATKWRNMPEEVQKALFSNTPYAELPQAYNDLALVASRYKQAGIYYNRAESGNTINLAEMFNKFVEGGISLVLGTGTGVGIHHLGSGNADMVAGSVAGIGAAYGLQRMSTAGGQFLVQNWMAKLLTNPTFVKWAATEVPAQAFPRYVNAFNAYLASRPDPDLSSAFNVYKNYVAQKTSPDAQLQPGEKGRTPLGPLNGATPFAEGGFAEWKQKHAPHDSGEDYDLKGAYEAGLTSDKQTGHWPDTFKKPNHPTFSDESKYSKENPDLPKGNWQGEHFFPPAPMADGGIAADPFGQPPQNGNIQGYSEGGHVPANENEFPGSLIDMVTKGNVIPFKSGAAGGHSGVQYDIMTTPQPGKAGYIKNPNTSDATLWTTNDPITKSQFDLFKANDNAQRRGLPKDAWRYRPPEEFSQGGSVNEESILDMIMKHESHGQNVMNYIGDKTHTAQGYYQITNSTWKDFAPKEILNRYPNAMSAPPDVQREVARIIYEAPNGGIGRWANYNPNLKAALGGSNMASNNNSISGKMPAQEQQTEQQRQEPELQDQNKSLIDSIMGANWIEPTTKLASSAILKGES